MAATIHPDGREEPTQPRNGRDFKLAELQEIVGGHIEIVPCKDKKHILVINEEGKLQRDPQINVKASELADLPTRGDIDAMRAALGEYVIVVGDDDPLHGPDVIVGTVLWCESREVR